MICRQDEYFGVSHYGNMDQGTTSIYKQFQLLLIIWTDLNNSRLIDDVLICKQAIGMTTTNDFN